MKAMKNAALAALMIAVATPAFAQQRDSARAPRGERGQRARAEMRARPDGPGRFGGGVESVLRMREELKLSAAQVNQLEALRKEIVAQRQNEARDMIDLQSRIAAGNIDRDEARKQMEGRRDAIRTTMEQRRDRMEKILTAEQREQVLRGQLRAERMRMRAPGGRGGFGPGMGRRGFAPRGFDGPPPRGRYRWN
jgi:Spy/CpxP family protein refolding chaperone